MSRITRETILVIDGAFPTVVPTIPNTSSPATTPIKTTPATSPASTPVPSAKTPNHNSTASPAPTPATSSAPSTPAKTTPATSPSSTPAPTAKAPAQKLPAAEAEDEMDLEEVNNVDNIVSNDVLENEVTMVDAQIAVYLFSSLEYFILL